MGDKPPFFPEILTFGKWIGDQCQLGYYSFRYIAQDEKGGLITEDGSENTYKLPIQKDHRLNKITLSRTHTDSEDVEVRLVPVKTDDTYYEILYSNSTWVTRSVIIELGDRYEDLADAEIHFVITGTNNKKWRPRVTIQILEMPKDV